MQLSRSVLAWRAGKAGLLAPRRLAVHPGAKCKPAGPPVGAPSSGAVDSLALIHKVEQLRHPRPRCCQAGPNGDHVHWVQVEAGLFAEVLFYEVPKSR